MNHSRREQFFLGVREALVLTQTPLMVASGAALISGQALETFVHQASDWLTPEVVKSYEPADYVGTPQMLQQQLDTTVAAFRLLANGISAPGMASYEQSKHGMLALETLAANTKDVVLHEWSQAARLFVDEIKEFCIQSRWPCQYKPKSVDEVLLGHYQIPQLTFQSKLPFVVEPLGRFVSGAHGAYDLTELSSGYMASFFRDDNNVWQIHVDVGEGLLQGGTVKFSKASFLSVVKDLEATAND